MVCITWDKMKHSRTAALDVCARCVELLQFVGQVFAVGSLIITAFCVLSFAAKIPVSQTALEVAQPSNPKRVLILLENDDTWPAYRLIDENVRTTLRKGSPSGILIFSEHLDRDHFSDPAIQVAQQNLIKRKYASSKIDLVIVVGGVPAGLFPGLPLVYLSADAKRNFPEGVTSGTKVVNVWVDLDARKTLEVARQLQPKARRIVVVGEESTPGHKSMSRIREMIATTAPDMESSYLTNLAVPEICRRVAVLGPERIVLFTGISHDPRGSPLVSAELIPMVAAASDAPVYSLADSHIGMGAVGGYVASSAEVGKKGGEMGLRILADEPRQDLGVPNVYLFDWRQLRRWRISKSALPAGSVVLNRQPTLWEDYRWYFIAAILLCIIETLLILGLLWHRSKRKKFENSFVDLMAFEKLISDLSATLINLHEEQVQPAIENSLGKIAEFLNLNRIDVFEYSKKSAELRVTSSWHSEGLQPSPSAVKAEQLPCWSKLLQRGEMVILSDLRALPELGSAECEHLRKLDAISAATLPLRAGGEFFGGISFISTSRRVLWTEGLIHQLKQLADILSNASMRSRALETQFRHTAIVESSDDAIISITLGGIIMSWNTGAQRLFGFSDAEAVGQPITLLVPDGWRDEANKILSRVRYGEHIKHYETVHIAKDGKKVDVSLTVSPIMNSKGVVVGVSKIARDITDRKRAERTLREGEERFRLVANTAPVLLWMSGPDKLCTFFNQCWLDFTGRPLEQELGNGWASGVYPEDLEHCLAIYSGAFEARAEFDMEYRLRRSDGKYRWIVDHGVPRFESDGTFCGYIGSCMDITDRKRTEDSLEELSGRLITAQEEERVRIARELHDDFSQRLALLGIGLGRLWKRRPESEEEERILVQKLWSQTKEITSDVHRLSHQLHSSKLEYVGLGPALRGLCEEISDKYRIQVEFTQRGVLSDIPKDIALCLFRICQESLSNVVKHSQAKQAQAELFSENNEVCLRITDSGLGFDLALRDANVGIGLIGMRERLRLVGGRLSVQSAPMRGTEILAEVPLPESQGNAPIGS
jgi:PAS domain S-box-containing protein